MLQVSTTSSASDPIRPRGILAPFKPHGPVLASFTKAAWRDLICSWVAISPSSSVGGLSQDGRLFLWCTIKRQCRNIPTRTMYVRRYVRTYYTYVCLSIACIAACMYVKEGMYYIYILYCIHLYVDPLAYIVILCGNIYMSIFMITCRSICGI